MFGIIGLVLGSFATAIIHRSQNNLSYIKNTNTSAARSMCPSCNHTLSAQDLIPIVSWLLQFGKCRYCKTKISSFYPVIEMISGCLCLLAVYCFSLGVAFLVLPLVPFLISFFYRLVLDSVFDRKLFFTLIVLILLVIIIFFFL